LLNVITQLNISVGMEDINEYIQKTKEDSSNHGMNRAEFSDFVESKILKQD